LPWPLSPRYSPRVRVSVLGDCCKISQAPVPPYPPKEVFQRLLAFLFPRPVTQGPSARFPSPPHCLRWQKFFSGHPLSSNATDLIGPVRFLLFFGVIWCSFFLPRYHSRPRLLCVGPEPFSDIVPDLIPPSCSLMHDSSFLVGFSGSSYAVSCIIRFLCAPASSS